MLEILLLCAAGFAAGALNAVAGGGTFLTFPALVWTGVPPIMANATATLTALPGYLGSAWAFRRDVGNEGSLGLGWIILVGACGGLLGSLLLLVTTANDFSGIVPWLLLAATVLFAVGPKFQVMTMAGGRTCPQILAVIAIFAVSVYGGYFNGGLGIMLLAVFGLIGFRNFHGMNGLKNVMSSLLSAVSVLTYAAAGLITWDAAVVLALATTVGGYLGARLSRRIRDPRPLRFGVVAIGAGMTAAFFLA